MRLLRSKKLSFFTLLLLPILGVFLAYSPVYKAGFISDDQPFLIEWPLLHNLENYPLFLKGIVPSGHEGVYRPLRTITQAVAFHFYKTNPHLYHTQAVVVHAFTTGVVFIILFLLLSLLPSKVSRTHAKTILLCLLGSIIFGLHPMGSEAVAFAQASFDSIGISFALLSYVLFLQALRMLTIKKNRTKGIVWLILSISNAFVAFLFYELSYTLPIIMIVTLTLVLLQKDNLNKKHLTIYGIIAPYILLLATIFIIRFGLLTIPNGRTLSSPSSWFTFLAMTRSLFHYMFQVVFPINLYHLHEIAPAITTSVGDPEFYTRLRITDFKTIVTIVSVFSLLFVAWKEKKSLPLITLGIIWFFVGLLPVLNIFPSGTIYSERFIYFSLVGFVCIILSVVEKSLSFVSAKKTQNYILILLICIVSILYSGRTFFRTIDWTDPVYFWTKEIQHLPKIGGPYEMRGIAYGKQGKTIEALLDFKQAIDLQPFDSKPYYNASILLYNLERYKEATSPAEQAFLLSPEVSSYAYHYAKTLIKIGQIKKAKKIVFDLTQKYPNDIELWYQLGTLSITDSDMNLAKYALMNLLSKDSTYTQGYITLGSLYNQEGSPAATVSLFERGNPNLDNKHLKADYYYTLASAFLKLSQTEKAREAIEEAFFLSPEDESIANLWKLLFLKNDSR